MSRTKNYRVNAVLHGEDVEVCISVGPAEPPGTPFAGERDVDVLSIRALSDGEDLIDHADELDLSALVGEVMDLERDAMEAAADDQSDRDREERYEF